MAISLNMSAVFGGIGRALGNRDYRRYWTGNTINTVGRWMYRMSVGWLTWQLTESTSWLGAVAFAETFPMVVFSIVGGAVADRVGYLRVVRVCQLATGCFGAVFAALTLGGLITIEFVLLLTLLIGSLDAVTTPARMSMVHSLVPRDDLSAAIALGSATFNAARIVGPAIAGALIVWIGIGPVLALSAVMFLQFFVVLLYIRVDEPDRSDTPSRNMIGDIMVGVKYVVSHPGVRFLMILLGATGLLIRPFIDLLPGVSDQVFDRGPDGLAILLSSIGLGATVSGLWLAQRGRTGGLTALVTASLMVSAVALILFTVAGFIWIAAFFLVVVGFFMLVGSIGSQTLIQNAVDSRMRARVMSLFVVISWGLPAFGALVMGWLASFAGLQPVIAAGGVLALVAWLWARRVSGRLAPALEQVVIDRHDGEEPARLRGNRPVSGHR